MKVVRNRYGNKNTFHDRDGNSNVGNVYVGP